MRQISTVLTNRVLWVSLLAWFCAQFSKILVILVTERKFKISRMVGSGGMPSSHASFAAALTMAIGFREGFGEPIFALAAAFALVVMYDAAGVRRATGRHAKILNGILRGLDDGRGIDQEQLKELVGHTPIEVLTGAMLGILVAALLA
jgi:acid phosphatase family membrane protein YuiD